MKHCIVLDFMDASVHVYAYDETSKDEDIRSLENGEEYDFLMKRSHSPDQCQYMVVDQLLLTVHHAEETFVRQKGYLPDPEKSSKT